MFIKSPVSNYTEILPVGAALLHADRRTDMKELTFSAKLRTLKEQPLNPVARLISTETLRYYLTVNRIPTIKTNMLMLFKEIFIDSNIQNT
jgi:hypothetical protein